MRRYAAGRAGHRSGGGGVLVLSLAGRGLHAGELLRATVQPAALCGLGTGAAFALTAICIKEANRALGPAAGWRRRAPGHVRAAGHQPDADPDAGQLPGPARADQLRAAFRTWRSSAWVGTLSACGSACWFTGFALAPVALVRSLGQVEMVFTLLFARFYLKEKPRRTDVIGLVLVVAGVILILRGR